MKNLKFWLTIVVISPFMALNAQIEDEFGNGSEDPFGDFGVDDGFGDDGIVDSTTENSPTTTEEVLKDTSDNTIVYAAISADAMNVLYVGLDNPLSIAVSGVDPKDLIVTLDQEDAGIELIGSNGKYSVHLTSNRRRQVGINVSAKQKDGSVKQIGKKIFRTKRVPIPRFAFGPIVNWSEPIVASSLRSVPLVSTYIDGFVYEGISYKVVAYEFELRRGEATKRVMVNGNSTSPIKQYLNNAKRGDIISFFNIQAKGPDGRIVVLDNVTAKIK